MRLLAPLADPASPLSRRNALAKLAATMLLTFVLLASVDPVTPAVAIALELALVPLTGIGYAALAARAWPVLTSTVGVFVFTVVFSTHRGGTHWLDAGPLHVSTDGLLAGLGLALRVVAVVLPGLAVFATTDATELADSLVQQLRVPARFAIGALAAFRLMPLLADEWDRLMMARRARGIDAGRNPAARLRLFASAMFALLVSAIRRGTRLATAMDARGFDAGTPRTVARPQRFTAADAGVVLVAAAVAATALAVSVLTGAYRPLF
jgi:energy-coupling factor transport system permease protein